MRPLNARARALALGGTMLLAVTPSAAAHLAHDQARDASVDPAEAASIGVPHAEAHAMARGMEAQRRQQPQSLTARAREERLETSERATQRLNATLGSRADVGFWEPGLKPLPEYAINSVTLPTGKILIWGRELGGPVATRNRGSAQLFDPVTGATRSVPPPSIPENPDGDGNAMAAPIFCAGQTFLSDGRVLLAGGNLSNPQPPGRPEFSGLDYTLIFDPWNEADPWELGPQMTNGRWYPTLTRLSSGDVLIAGGLDENGQGSRNGWLDIWRPGENPTPLTPLVPYPAGERSDPDETTTPDLAPDAQFGLSLYPMMQLLPDGDVALAGPGQQDSAILDSSENLEDPGRTAAPGSAWTHLGRPGQFPGQLVPGTVPSRIHQGGMSLLEPDLRAFGGTWQLLAMAGSDDPAVVPPGGQPRDFYKPARPTVDRLDATPSVRQWSHDPQNDLNQGRLYANSVLLPDGGIVVVGGGLGAWPQVPGLYYVGENEPGGVPAQLKQVELRRPGERTWRLGAAQQEHRTYHSTALLLPDGRIMSAGDDGRAKLVASRDDAEIYWPPNLFDGDDCALRPVIRGVGAPNLPPPSARQSATLTYGEQLGIFTEHAGTGMQAVLVAPAATTHSNDMNQRVVPLRVDATVAGGGLNVTMPATATIAAPGYYMLFVVGSDGTPSEARWVHVLPAQQAAAERGGATPALATGARPSPQGRSCVNPDGTRRSEPDPTPVATTATPQPGAAEVPRPAPAAKLPAKLAVARAAVKGRSRRLDVLAPISALASGRVDVDLFSAGRHTRMKVPIDSKRRRVRILRAIPRAQAALGTGIVTLTYRGNAATFAQTVRLRAARGKAGLTARRPTLSAGGRLRATGKIRGAARGVVRIELQFGVADGVRTLRFSAKIKRGAWKLDRQLTRTERAAIGAREATVHATVLFTGYAAARMRGEMRSYQLLAAR